MITILIVTYIELVLLVNRSLECLVIWYHLALKKSLFGPSDRHFYELLVFEKTIFLLFFCFAGYILCVVH